MIEIRQEVEEQRERDARKAAHDVDMAAKKAEKDARKVIPDNKPVTWGDLRALGLVE